MQTATHSNRPTSDKVLLGRAVDAGQVAAVLPAVLLGVLPGVSPAEVPVAVAVELPPGVVAALRVCRRRTGKEGTRTVMGLLEVVSTTSR